MSAAVAIGCIALVGGAAATPALADLPRTYDATVHESPVPGPVAQYPLGLANAGDLDGDGKEDFITSQLVNTRNDSGQISATGNGAIYIVSGATGQRIRTIESPDPGGQGNRANFAFPWVSKVGTNRSAAPFTDLARCTNPPPNAGELCRATTIGPPDGIPDILVGARGVDANGRTDSGRVYVYDGATFALLKRIDAPLSDTTPLALSRSGGSWFGRVVLNPAGLAPCAGNAGVGACDNLPNSVVSGDMDGGGLPDFIASASAHTEDWTTAHPASHCARTTGARCEAAGRVYVYRGENIVGSSPAEILDGTVPAGGTAENVTTIRHPHAQADDVNYPTNSDGEQIGNYMFPIGDVGACRAVTGPPAVPIPPPGDMCPRNNSVTTPDGSPEFIAGVAAQDLPLDNPDPVYADAGIAYLIDGRTNTILNVYRNPEPLLASRFSSNDVGHPTGDLGDTSLPDTLIGAPAQLADSVHAAGAAYAMNGNFKTGVGNFMFGRLQDPSPVASENFGGAWTGVGDLVPGPATPANEVLVGGPSGFFGAGPKSQILSDVTFFNAATSRALMTIRDPANQPASQFGAKIIPMGDLNGDTLLDFAVAASLHDTADVNDAGRVYIFTSNNAPPPPPPPPPAPPAPPPAPPAPPAPPPPVAPAAVELLPGRCANDMRGTSGGDNLFGTSAGDAVFALDGDDVVEALAGHDCVDAAGDDDDVSGHAGNDSLLGGAGSDELDGGSGADRVFGQSGNDILVGGSGNDMLAGGDGNDLLTGGSGRNRLFGERGSDRLAAGETGGAIVDGGSGNDRIDAANGRRDRVRCGSGLDRAILDRVDRAAGCERITRKRA